MDSIYYCNNVVLGNGRHFSFTHNCKCVRVHIYLNSILPRAGLLDMASKRRTKAGDVLALMYHYTPLMHIIYAAAGSTNYADECYKTTIKVWATLIPQDSAPSPPRKMSTGALEAASRWI